jgi:hypothetical protein
LSFPAQRQHALPDREHRAGEEDPHGGDEGPEEPLLAVPELVPVVGRPPPEPQRGEEHELVERVRERVSPLGEHRGRSAGEPRHELGDGDQRVGRQRHQDR